MGHLTAAVGGLTMRPAGRSAYALVDSQRRIGTDWATNDAALTVLRYVVAASFYGQSSVIRSSHGIGLRARFLLAKEMTGSPRRTHHGGAIAGCGG
jgi:hypothetical protein